MKLRSQGATSTYWGLGFGLYLWAGARALGLREERAVPFALLAAAMSTLFIYLGGAALEKRPPSQPGLLERVVAAGRLKRTDAPSSSTDDQAAEQKRWVTWAGLPAVTAAVALAIVFTTGREWVLGFAFAALIIDIGVLIWLALSSDTNGPTDGAH